MDPFHPVDEPAARAARKSQFARFHDDNHPQLVALLHALTGDRAHATRAALRAFVQAWRHWPTVGSLPDPAGWTRRRARQVRPPRRPPRPDAEAHEAGWVAQSARPIFTALRQLPEEERTVAALHHVGGLAVEQIAEEEHLPIDVVMARLAAAYQVMAERLGWIPPGGRSYRVPDPSQPIHTWAAIELTELAHALAYRTDQRALDQVFRVAVRQRVTVTAAAAAVVTIGLAGTLTMTQHPTVRYDVPLPPAGSPAEQVLPRLPSGGRSTGAPPVPGPFYPSGLSPAGPPNVDPVDDLVPAGSVTELDYPPTRSAPTGPGGSSHSAPGGYSEVHASGGGKSDNDGDSDGDGHSRGGSQWHGSGHSGGGGHSGGDGHGDGGGGHGGGGHGGGHGHGGGGHGGGGGGHGGGGHGGGGHGGGGHGGGGHGGGGHGGGGHGH
jgi:DNA-directed RNA polymerase specialized sigma24 family protein/uncharacterized membrane protein YgcG